MKNFLFTLAAAALLTSCEKDVEALPEPTQTGANIFGARVDGEFWVPQKFGIAPTAPLLEARYSGNNSVFINARNFSSSPTETEFEIYLRNVKESGTGTILLNQLTGKYPQESASYGYFIKRKFMPLGEWITGPQHTGSVTITRMDTTNHIISGTFQFTAKSMDDTAEPISVTEGRFDIKIQ
jgi:hypothetical protein